MSRQTITLTHVVMTVYPHERIAKSAGSYVADHRRNRRIGAPIDSVLNADDGYDKGEVVTGGASGASTGISPIWCIGMMLVFSALYTLSIRSIVVQRRSR